MIEKQAGPPATRTRNVPQPPHGRAWCWWLVLVLPAVCIALMRGLRYFAALRDGQLLNPDSYMRLVRVHEMLAAGHTVETIANDASGNGFVLHWSHLLDAIVLLMAAPFRSAVPWDQALLMVSDAMGPLQMALLAIAMAWAARPFVAKPLLPMAPVLMAIMPGTVDYARPGVLHHHIPALAVSVMLGGLAARVLAEPAEGRRGWQIGLWATLGLWLTPETTPLIVAAFGLVYAGWLEAPGSRRIAGAARDAGLAFVLSAACVVAIDPPGGGIWTAATDRLSILSVGLAGVAAAMGAAMAAIDGRARTQWARLLLSAAAGLAAGGAWFLAFKGTLLGPTAFGGDPGLEAMHPLITELKPVDTIPRGLTYLVPGLLGTTLLCVIAARRRSLVLAYGGIVSLLMVIAAQRHVRFACYPDALGVAVTLTALSWLNRPGPAPRQMMIRLATLASLITAPIAGAFLSAARTPAEARACSVTHLGPMLAPYAGHVVLSDVDVVPELLYRTQVLTVASLYLRNGAAWLRWRDAWSSTSFEAAPPVFAAAHIEFVLACRNVAPIDAGTDSLGARLARGDVPPWLRAAASDPASGNTLYQVVR